MTDKQKNIKDFTSPEQSLLNPNYEKLVEASVVVGLDELIIDIRDIGEAFIEDEKVLDKLLEPNELDTNKFIGMSKSVLHKVQYMSITVLKNFKNSSFNTSKAGLEEILKKLKFANKARFQIALYDYGFILDDMSKLNMRGYPRMNAGVFTPIENEIMKELLTIIIRTRKGNPHLEIIDGVIKIRLENEIEPKFLFNQKFSSSGSSSVTTKITQPVTEEFDKEEITENEQIEIIENCLDNTFETGFKVFEGYSDMSKKLDELIEWTKIKMQEI